MLESIGLLIGHLVGDYVLQNDWMAREKAAPHPGRKPAELPDLAPGSSFVDSVGHTCAVFEKLHEWDEWRARNRRWWVGHLACTVHCALYTFAVWVCSAAWMPWWVAVAVFLAHWPVDRWRLASKFMHLGGWQSEFASGPLAPWSAVVVDNILHLWVLWVLACVSLS